MANRNIQIKNKNGETWDNLFPLTLSENVYDNEGKSVATHVSDSNIHRPIKITNTEPTVNDLEVGEIALFTGKDYRPIAEYKFDEHSGDSAKDTSLNRNDLQMTGTTRVVGLDNGYSRQFNGESDFMATEPNFLFAGVNKLKIELTYRRESDKNINAYETIFSNYRDINNVINGFYLNHRTHNENYGGSDPEGFIFRIAGGGQNSGFIPLRYTAQIGEVYHFVAEWDGEAVTVDLYDESGTMLIPTVTESFSGEIQDNPTELFVGRGKGNTQFAHMTIDNLIISTWE